VARSAGRGTAACDDGQAQSARAVALVWLKAIEAAVRFFSHRAAQPTARAWPANPRSKRLGAQLKQGAISLIQIISPGSSVISRGSACTFSSQTATRL
jgi:hypothetical protein